MHDHPSHALLDAHQTEHHRSTARTCSPQRSPGGRWSPPLTWSNELAADAQAYAEKLARTQSFQHATCDDGENLYWYSATTAHPGEDASLSWLEERDAYRHGRGWHRNFSEVGHYTQMIWKDTKQVGIGTAVASDGSTYVVARYHPAGNYTNQLPY